MQPSSSSELYQGRCLKRLFELARFEQHAQGSSPMLPTVAYHFSQALQNRMTLAATTHSGFCIIRLRLPLVAISIGTSLEATSIAI